MESLHLLNKEQPHYLPGEIISLSLKCSAQKLWSDVKFRFEIKYQDTTPAGTMLCDRPVQFKAGEVRAVSMNFDTEHLAPGRYRVDIIAYVYDEFGTEQFIDGVYPGFVFEIEEVVDEHHPLRWMHQYWGHAHLHDVAVL